MKRKNRKRKSDETVIIKKSEVDFESFSSFNLDDRILQAIAKLGWEKPTLIQEKLIPLVLDGKDVVAKARTGTGKTAAFAIPIVQKILERKMSYDEGRQFTRALVLTPTKELSAQVCDHFNQLCTGCSVDVKLLDFSNIKELETQRSLLIDQKPDIVVGTPGRLLNHADYFGGSGGDLEFLVMDEADLLLSFGYERDIRQILSKLSPVSYQAILTSATMKLDAQLLKCLTLKNAVTLQLEESELPDSGQLTQYHIKCDEEDKFVLIYALVKLRLIRGKTLIFVSTTDRCYRLRLFLEQFGINSCVLNSEMPVNSRCHIVDQFNQNRYDFIIASDVADMFMVVEKSDEIEQNNQITHGNDQLDKIDIHNNNNNNNNNNSNNNGKKTKKINMDINNNKSKKSKRRKLMDKESGISRGIDFQRVANVVNFDFPPNTDAYIHRVGRTARGLNKGTSLSFVTESDLPVLAKVESVLNEQMGSDVMKRYEFRMDELDAFRYRARDVMRAVTGSAVREARLAEIKNEALRSEKLESYFLANPRETSVLSHDKTLHTVKVVSAGIRDVPDYIVPPTLRGTNYGVKLVKKRKRSRNFLAKNHRPTKSELKFQRKRADPLLSFETE